MTLRKDEYARRRKQLMKLMGKGAIAIIPAAPERQRNSDVHYHYRPDSDFHYLTGFNEPEAVAVLRDGLHVHCNTAWVHLFGFESGAELVGQELAGRLDPEGAARLRAHLAETASGSAFPDSRTASPW